MCTSFPNGKPWMSIAVLVPTQSIIPSKLADYRGSQSMVLVLPFFNQVVMAIWSEEVVLCQFFGWKIARKS